MFALGDFPLWSSSATVGISQVSHGSKSGSDEDDQSDENGEESWQLGGINSAFVSANAALPPGITVAETDTFKAPTEPFLKRRGRPSEMTRKIQETNGAGNKKV